MFITDLLQKQVAFSTFWLYIVLKLLVDLPFNTAEDDVMRNELLTGYIINNIGKTVKWDIEKAKKVGRTDDKIFSVLMSFKDAEANKNVLEEEAEKDGLHKFENGAIIISNSKIESDKFHLVILKNKINFKFEWDYHKREAILRVLEGFSLINNKDHPMCLCHSYYSNDHSIMLGYTKWGSKYGWKITGSVQKRLIKIMSHFELNTFGIAQNNSPLDNFHINLHIQYAFFVPILGLNNDLKVFMKLLWIIKMQKELQIPTFSSDLLWGKIFYSFLTIRSLQFIQDTAPKEVLGTFFRPFKSPSMHQSRNNAPVKPLTFSQFIDDIETKTPPQPKL